MASLKYAKKLLDQQNWVSINCHIWYKTTSKDTWTAYDFVIYSVKYAGRFEASGIIRHIILLDTENDIEHLEL